MVRPSGTPSRKDGSKSSSSTSSERSFADTSSCTTGIASERGNARTPSGRGNTARRGTPFTPRPRGGRGRPPRTPPRPNPTPPSPNRGRGRGTAVRGRGVTRTDTPRPSHGVGRRSRSPTSRKSPPETPRAPRSPKKKAAEKKTIPGRRYRPNTKALAEIRHYQSSTNNLIPRLPFQRLVREITQRIRGDFRYTGVALSALQTASEFYIIGLLEDSYLCTLHAKRVTLMERDLKLAYRIRGDAISHH